MSEQENSDGEGQQETIVLGENSPGAVSGGGRQINREEMVARYLPDEGDWEAKTILDLNGPALIAALSELGTMYPEVDDLQPLIDSVLDEFLRSKTSIGGASREEYKGIMQSMFGGKPDDDDASTALARALVGDHDD